MSVITALEIQARNKERVNVYLDGEYAFSLALIQAVKLQKGQTLAQDEINALRSADEVERAVESAVRFLANRPRSVMEVRRNLNKKKVKDVVIDEAISHLEAVGYLDDVAFARYWVENRDTFNPRGPMAIRYELRQKGISDAIISTVLDELDVRDAAYRAARTKAARFNGLTQQVFYQKLGSFLQRRGFSFATCRDVINQITAEIQQENPDFFQSEEDDYFGDF